MKALRVPSEIVISNIGLANRVVSVFAARVTTARCLQLDS